MQPSSGHRPGGRGAGRSRGPDALDDAIESVTDMLTDTWKLWVPAAAGVALWWGWTREAWIGADGWDRVRFWMAVAGAVLAVLAVLRVGWVLRTWRARAAKQRATERAGDALAATRVRGEAHMTDDEGRAGFIQLAPDAHMTDLQRDRAARALSAKLGHDVELSPPDSKDRVAIRPAASAKAVELPTLVRYPLDRPPAKGRVIEYGVGLGGKVIAWDQTSRPHCIVTGETGAGKTGVMRALIYGALRKGYHVRIVDPKKREFRSLDGLPNLKRSGDGWGDEAVEGMVSMIEKIHAEMQRRYGLTDDEIDALPRILLVIDEFYELVAALNRWFKENKKDLEMSGTEHPAVGLLSSLATLARSAGIHLLFGIQRPDTKVMGHEGGLIRAQMGYRISVGPLDRNGALMMWDDDWERARSVPDVKGRVLHTAAGGPQLGQVWWVDLNDEAVVAALRPAVGLAKG